MTKPANYESKTQFSDWLREQPELHSRKHGFSATDIDYVWQNYRSRKWMILEEKRMFGSGVFPNMKETRKFKGQYLTLKMVNNLVRSAFQKDYIYIGIFLLVFENTSPDNGKIWIDTQRNEVTERGLIEFLQFKGRLHKGMSELPCYVCGSKKRVRPSGKIPELNLCWNCVMYLRVLCGYDFAKKHFTSDQMKKLLGIKEHYV